MIVAPNGSDLTQADLDRALENLIIDRMHDESKELQRIGRALVDLGDEIEEDDTFAPERVAHFLKLMANLGDQLTTAHQKLSSRSEALSAARSDASKTADSTLRLSA
ncbi:MAG: hypothetical protein ACO1Q7_02025 [Gemmatimonas sp.]